MCDPISLASVAMTGGSVLANSAAASSVAKARSRVLSDERTRQAQYDQQASQYQEHSRGLYDNFAGQQGDRAQQLGDYLSSGTGKTGVPAGAGTTGNSAPSETLPGATSGLVVQEDAKQAGKAAAFTNQQGQALGAMRAFGDLLGDNSRAQARDAGYIGQIDGFKQGSSAVVPYELDAASHAGDGKKMFGDLLSAGGQLGTAYGLTRNVAPGLSGAAATSAPQVSLPSFAQPQPTAPMTLSTSFGAAPSFSLLGNLFTRRA